jgi:hypothetical protein
MVFYQYIAYTIVNGHPAKIKNLFLVRSLRAIVLLVRIRKLNGNS